LSVRNQLADWHAAIAFAFAFAATLPGVDRDSLSPLRCTTFLKLRVCSMVAEMDGITPRS
jgi:hypothetical protein